MRRSLRRTRSRSRATYGCSAAIDCSAATAQWRATLRACSVASRRTLWSPTRPTASITTRLPRPDHPTSGRMGVPSFLIEHDLKPMHAALWDRAVITLAETQADTERPLWVCACADEVGAANYACRHNRINEED